MIRVLFRTKRMETVLLKTDTFLNNPCPVQGAPIKTEDMEKYSLDTNKKTLFENSCIPFAIYQFVNRRVVTIALSQGFCELFGLSKEEAYILMDHDMYRDAHPDDVARIADAAYQFAVNGEIYEVVYRTKAPSEKDYTVVHAYGRHVYTETGERLAVVWYVNEGLYGDMCNNMGELVQQSLSQKLHWESLIRENYYDYLTGLPNMLYFLELAQSGRQKIQESGGMPAILFVDLNGMKSYNRRYGFAEGDNLLRAFSKLLVRYFSNENCGRFTSDHFTVYTETHNLEKKLDDLFAEADRLNDNRSLSLRVGIYVDRFENVSISTACDRAKTACDLERNTYASRYVYYDEKLRSASLKKNYILDNLDRAIEEKWIRVFYQPIVRTVTGKVCDEEALARWIDPTRGILAPEEFIPVLEDAHLLYKLDLFMVEQVLANMKRQKEAGVDVVPVSVNFSRNDFAACDMVKEVCRRVDEAGVSHNMLNIEITESVIGLDYDFMKDQIDRFHEAGFNIWMDDFGTGYSALDVLQKFDFDVIKFDMEFLSDFHRSEKNHIILTQLMQMAVKLGIGTVAEGVETEEHLRFLAEIGCDRIQGFYYSRPIPLDVIIDRYDTGIGIGRENALESLYYSTISMTNLNDPAINDGSDSAVNRYFNAVPMGIVEVENDEFFILRSNKTFGDFIRKTFHFDLPLPGKKGQRTPVKPDQAFLDAAKQCNDSGQWVPVMISHEQTVSINAYVRQIAVNPFSGNRAILIVILSMLS